MHFDKLVKLAEDYIHTLCVEIGERTVGREGNRRATGFFRERLNECGFAVESSLFDCMDWQSAGAHLNCGEESFIVFSTPYALGCDVESELVVLSTVTELEGAELKGKVALLCGELAKEQIMPKNFPFYNPDEHRHIVGLLESKLPAALVTATGRNPELAGGLYPFPMFEDGDFDIPSVFMTDVEGDKLKAFAGQRVHLVSRAQRSSEIGYNVLGRRGSGAERIVISAHVDCKLGTTGGVDNGTGTVIQLLLAKLLSNYNGAPVIEINTFNGEDYYAAPGAIKYLEENAGKLDSIKLAINIDLAAYKDKRAAYSFYECPPEIESLARKAFSQEERMAEGPQWYQGDHMVFVQNGRPALAIASEDMEEITGCITHTAADNIEVTNAGTMARVALALYDLIMGLGE